jgi:predicted nucleic acid-binding protein
MTLVLDTGALIALERGDRAMWRRAKAALIAGEVPVTHAGVVGQAWRTRGPRQALLAKALAGIDVRVLDEVKGRAAGELLGRTRRSDVIDAALALLSCDGDVVLTSDPKDIAALVKATGIHAEIVAV